MDTVDTIAIVDEGLLKMARHIFGEDLVKSAFIAETCIDGPGYSSSTERDLLKAGPWIKGTTYEDYDILGYDERTIIIQFMNDRFILFTNSEWASMENVPKENIHFSAFSSIECG